MLPSALTIASSSAILWISWIQLLRAQNGFARFKSSNLAGYRFATLCLDSAIPYQARVGDTVLHRDRQHTKPIYVQVWAGHETLFHGLLDDLEFDRCADWFPAHSPLQRR